MSGHPLADREQIIANCKYLYPDSNPTIVTTCEEVSDDATSPASATSKKPLRTITTKTRWRRTIAVLDGNANNAMLFSSAVTYDAVAPIGINASTFVHILNHSEKRVAAKLKLQRENEQRIVRDVLRCVGKQETWEVKERLAKLFLAEDARRKILVEDARVQALVEEVRAKLESGGGIGTGDGGEGSSGIVGAPPPPYFPHEVCLIPRPNPPLRSGSLPEERYGTG